MDLVALDDAQLRHLLTLARLEVTDDALERLEDDLNRVLAYVEALSELDTDGVEPLVRPLVVEEAFREDDTRPPLPRAGVLQLGRTDEDGRFVVPRTVDEGN